MPRVDWQTATSDSTANNGGKQRQQPFLYGESCPDSVA